MLEFKKVPNLVISLFAGVFIATLSPAAQLDQGGNYQRLAELLRPATLSTDFVALTDYQEAYEKTVHDASREYFNSHPELVQRIRDDLGSQEIQWQLKGLSHRLVYAPESRKDVATLFTDYCQEAIEDLLARTGLVNPYSSISTLVENIPNVSSQQGIKAFIVQDLAREYVARYRFSGTAKKRIELDLSGRLTINEVGSYSSYLQYSEKTQHWEFTRDRHTVWKSASANPYTVLMTPLEETLHIVLRQHTEKAIMEAAVFKDGIPSLKEAQTVVDNWLAVEEAVVGGLVYNLVPEVVLKRVPDLSMEWVRADLETKTHFEKYRYLRRAIAVVESQGLKESIHLYARDPTAFRALLTERG